MFFFHDSATTGIYTLSLHDALPISVRSGPAPSPGCTSRRSRGSHYHQGRGQRDWRPSGVGCPVQSSEEHTSELQSHVNLVCRLLLEKKKNKTRITVETRTHPRQHIS